MKTIRVKLTVISLAFLSFFVPCGCTNANSTQETEDGVESVKITRQIDSLNQTISVGAIVSGKKEGYWRMEDSLGRIKAEFCFLNDSLEGEFITYYENGRPSVVGYMKKGNWDGENRSYYVNGILQSRSYYDDGERVGMWKDWDEKGELNSIIQYKADTVFKVIQYNELIPLTPNLRVKSQERGNR